MDQEENKERCKDCVNYFTGRLRTHRGTHITLQLVKRVQEVKENERI